MSWIVLALCQGLTCLTLWLYVLDCPGFMPGFVLLTLWVYVLDCLGFMPGFELLDFMALCLGLSWLYARVCVTDGARTGW